MLPRGSSYLAEHIPGARFVELDAGDHAIWYANQDRYLATISAFLTGSPPPPVTERVLATVMLSDVVGSTGHVKELGDREWAHLLDHHDTVAAQVVDRWGGRVVKSTGDGFLATFDGPSRAVHAASALVDRIHTETGLELRIGLHCGEIEIRDDQEIGGVAVHLASQLEPLAPPGGVTISRTVKDLVAGSDLTFTDRGEHALKGIEGSWQLFDLDQRPAGSERP